MRERIKYADNLNVIAIFMVCFCQLSLLIDKTNICLKFLSVICYAGIPIFFMVVGVRLLNEGYENAKHLKNTINLFVVMIIWECIAGICMMIAYKIDISRISIGNIVDYLGGFWFMRTLVMIYVIYPLVKFTFNSENGKKYLKVFCAVLFVSGFASNTMNFISIELNRFCGTPIYGFNFLKIYNPMNLINSGQCIFFFIVGALLEEKFYNNAKIKTKQVSIVCIIAILLGWIGLFIVKIHYAGFNDLSFGYSRISTVLIAIGIFVLALLFERKKNKLSNIIEIMSDNIFGVFYLQIILSKPISTVGLYLNVNSVLRVLLETIIVIALSIIITEILNKNSVTKRLI